MGLMIFAVTKSDPDTPNILTLLEFGEVSVEMLKTLLTIRKKNSHVPFDLNKYIKSIIPHYTLHFIYSSGEQDTILRIHRLRQPLPPSRDSPKVIAHLRTPKN